MMMARNLCLWFFTALMASGCITVGHDVAQSSQGFADDEAFRNWFSAYYLAPQPERLTAALRYMHKEGYLEEDAGSDMPLIASVFVARVLAKNSGQVARWSDESWQKLSSEEWYVLLISLYMADTPATRQVLKVNLSKVDKVHRQRLAAMQEHPSVELDPMHGPLVSERQVNLLWSAFSATGEKRYIQKVITAVPLYGDDDEQRARVGEAALMSLAANALQHKMVAEVCADARGHATDNKTQALLTAMLAAVADIARNGRLPDGLSH